MLICPPTSTGQRQNEAFSFGGAFDEDDPAVAGGRDPGPAMSAFAAYTFSKDSVSLPGDVLLPASTFATCLQGLLVLDPVLRDIVAWRYQGVPYKEIARRQGTSTQLAEMRHKRALRDWPALKALFPEKVAKQSRRRKGRA